VKRWVLEGTDYVYPRTTNKILEAYLKSKGVKDEDISINYTPFGHADWQTRVAENQEIRFCRQEDRGGLDDQR
jgi:urea transport system substrate-binding protein